MILLYHVNSKFSNGYNMIINSIKGDIFAAFMESDADVFIQGNNCHHMQNSGIAGIIKHRYPEALQADINGSIKGDPNKLGTYTIADTRDGKIINAYTQYDYGTDKRNADYDAIAKVFRKINDDFKDQKLNFIIPSIGAGLALGDWEIISNLINENTPDINITHYYL